MTARPRFKHRGPKLWALQFCASDGDWLPASGKKYRTLASAVQACHDRNQRDDKWFYRVVQRERHREAVQWKASVPVLRRGRARPANAQRASL